MPKHSVDYRITLKETQILKSFAIMAMLAHHLFYEHPEFGTSVMNLGISCKICVALFVFLSGYGMAASFPQKMNRHSNTIRIHFFVLCRRYVKFFLNYWFIFFITVPLGIFIFGRSLESAYGEGTNLAKSFIMDVLGLQGFSSYNITWWFNAVILALWFFFPFLYWIMKKRIASICLIILIWINPYDLLYSLHFIALGLATWFLPFVLGVFIALHIDRINKILNSIHPNAVLCISISLTFFLLYLRGVKVFPSFTQFQVDPFATIFLSLAVVSICRKTKLRFSFLQFVGKHSMNMYLTHTFIFGYFFSNFIYGFKYPIAIFTVLFLTSLLLSICIEFIKKKIGFYRLQDKIIKAIRRLQEPSETCKPL